MTRPFAWHNGTDCRELKAASSLSDDPSVVRVYNPPRTSGQTSLPDHTLYGVGSLGWVRWAAARDRATINNDGWGVRHLGYLLCFPPERRCGVPASSGNPGPLGRPLYTRALFLCAIIITLVEPQFFSKAQMASRMHARFLAALAVLLQLVICVPQGRALLVPTRCGCAKLTAIETATPAITAAAESLGMSVADLQGGPTSSHTCGGCYIVADVAGLIWYSEIFINTAATQVVSVGVGNGTRATRTSIIANDAQFTFDPTMATAMASAPLALTQVLFDSVTTIAGAVLCVLRCFYLNGQD